MTEKRYYLQCDEINAWSIHETDGDVIVFDLLKSDAEVVCDLLNQLNDENEQLKSSNMEMEDYCARIEEKNEQLKQTITEAYETERTHIGRNVLKQLLQSLE